LIFLDILQTFRNFALDILPLFIIAFAISAVSARYFAPASLDALIKRNDNRAVLVSAFFGVLLPVTSGCRIPMAAIARRGGASWTPVLTFIGAGAAAGISTVVVTLLIGWQFAVLRLIVALLFALFLSLIIVRVLEPRFAGVAMDSEIEPLFHRDFCETSAEDSFEVPVKTGFIDLWHSLLRLGRVVLPWLFLSLLLATLIHVVVPDKAVEALLGDALSAPRAALIGLPFYFVIGTDIPLLIVLLNKGMSLGGAVTFMLAAPIINFPVLSIIGRWLGYRRALAFMFICWIIASAIGISFGYIDTKL